ncbi:MAG: D-tyrosyl-tRNA(Tyr) deacylase [Nitrospirae bacterium]|nr:D-tyrosyl-tRNA(Tyr) deacylase [Nitrospirota bacterium]
MKAVIQRVSEAQVSVEQTVVGRIGPGLVVLLGVAKEDTAEDADYLADRILAFRIFDDEAGKMNHSVQDIGGQILVISQFTLVATVVKGRRPSFEAVAGRESAQRLYHRFVDRLIAGGLTVETGRFGAQMIVSLHNDGPVTFILES